MPKQLIPFAIFTLVIIGLMIPAYFHKSKYLVEVEAIQRKHGPWKVVQVGPDVTYLLGHDGRVWFISDRGGDAPLVETKE